MQIFFRLEIENKTQKILNKKLCIKQERDDK